MSSVAASTNFEYMYSPARARNLYSRYRDLSHGYERQKRILDWERHTVVSQLDKAQVRFTQKATKMFADHPELKEKVTQFNLKRRPSSAIPKGDRKASMIKMELRPVSSYVPMRRDSVLSPRTKRRASSAAELQTKDPCPQTYFRSQKEYFRSIQMGVRSDTKHAEHKIKQFIENIELYKKEYKKSLEKQILVEVKESEKKLEDDEPPQQRGFNRSSRNVGSQFKMVVMAAMMQSQSTPKECETQDTVQEESLDAKQHDGEDETLAEKSKEDTEEIEGRDEDKEDQKKNTPRDVKKSVEFADVSSRRQSFRSRRGTNEHIHKTERPTTPKPQLNPEDFAPSNKMMWEAWDAFTKDVNATNLRRLTHFAAKNKGKFKDSSSRTPALAARKAIEAFKELVTRARRRQVALEQGHLLQERNATSDDADLCTG